MKYRTLGRTGLSVSEVGFGAWAIGGTSYGLTRDEDSLDALAAAWEHGVNFFDTADTYGHGHSEELIGKFLKGKREQAIIASKVGWDFYHGGSKKNFDSDYIRFACEESLKRLGAGHIDLYQLHNPKLEMIQSGEIFKVLDELKAAGKIRFYGVSIHTPAEALAVIDSGKADTVQLIFNLLDQRCLEEVFPKAKAAQTGIIVREPLACGLLTGKYTPESKFEKDDHRNRWDREKLANDIKKVERIKSILKTPRLSPVRVALEYILSYEEIGVVIPGAKTKAHVEEHVLASEESRLRIEEIALLRRIYQEEELFQTGFYRS